MDDAVAVEWTRILLSLTPARRLGRPSDPAMLLADQAATILSAGRVCPPEALRLDGLTDSDEMFEVLRVAALAVRADSVRNGGRRLAASEDYEQRLLVHDWVASLVEQRSHGLASGLPSLLFLYYQEGDAVGLHIDTAPDYEFNLLMPLQVVAPTKSSRSGSATYFLLGEGKRVGYRLKVGQAVWFHGRHTPHGRTPLLGGEEVTLLSIGYNRAR